MNLTSYAVRFTLYVLRFTPRLALRPWARMLALGALSLLVYSAGLLAPYNLFALRLKPLQDVARLTRGQPLAQAGFVLTLAVLSGLYYLQWRLCRPADPPRGERETRAMWLALFAGLAAVNLALLWLYPIGAADLFDNIMRGRIAAVYGGNPFYKIPSDYAGDPFYRYIAWRYSPSAYGPLWELLAAGTSRLAGVVRLRSPQDDILANILAFKLLGLLFYGGCLALIAGILNRAAPERALAGVCLFAWNPLVIYETAGNGHNDIVMAFFILLGMYALLRQRYAFAALALTAGALVKFISILLVPIVLAVAWRALPKWKPRLSGVAAALFACVGLGLLLYAPFWRGGDPLSLQRRETLFTTSLPAMIETQLEAPLGRAMSQRLVARLALLATGLAVVLQTLRAWREADWLSPIRAGARLLLFYLLFTCLWFQPWYALWPLALAALLPEGALGRAIVLLSYSAVWKTIFFNFVLFPGPRLPPRVQREAILAPATLGLTWLYAGYAYLRAQLCKVKAHV